MTPIPARVFIVSRGEANEGGDAIGVYASREQAQAVALSRPTHFEGGWVPSPHSPDLWWNKCDFVSVSEWPVVSNIPPAPVIVKQLEAIEALILLFCIEGHPSMISESINRIRGTIASLTRPTSPPEDEL